MLLSAMLLGADVAGAQTPVPLSPPAALDRQALDMLFDGSGSFPEAAFTGVQAVVPDGDFIIRIEDDPVPAAPRYALNLDAVPPHLRRTIDGFDQLFHKNQEETEAWVEHINGIIRKRNEGRWFKIPEWTYDGRPNEPVWTCLADSAGTVNDWWALQLGRELGEYRSATTGRTVRGLNTDMLEAEYRERAHDAEDNDPDFVIPPKFVQKDPVRNTGFAYEPRGYAKLLVEDEPYEAKNYATGEEYRYDPSMSAMEGEYKQLFTNSIFRDRTPAKYAKVLADAVEKYGIVYTQLEHTDHPRWPGAHSVAVVGYFCMEGRETLIDCGRNHSAEDWGRTTYFIVHDSFGGFPATRVRDADGASAYRAVRIFSVDQAIVFPHSLKVRAVPDPAVPGVWRIQAANKGGQPVQVLFARALEDEDVAVPVQTDSDGSLYIHAEPGTELRLYIEARHYYQADGNGRVFDLVVLHECPGFGVHFARHPQQPDEHVEHVRAHV